MNRPYTFLLALLFTGPSIAADICCILAKKDQSTVLTRSEIASDARCKPGANFDGFTVCSAKPDPQNLCSQMTAEQSCAACGYFWNGACLTEDPVEVAKKKLKEELAKTPAPVNP